MLYRSLEEGYHSARVTIEAVDDVILLIEQYNVDVRVLN